MTGRDARSLLQDVADDADLRQAVALIATLADEPAPPPSAALADLLDRGFEPTVLPFRRPAGQRRRWAARTGAGLVAAAASVVVAGTAAALPAPLQETVADLVSALTPFELPRPPADEDRVPTGSDEESLPSGSPAATTASTPSAPVPTEPAARPTGGPGRAVEYPDDHASPDRQERDQQRADEEAAEESAETAEDAADDAQEAAREREDAAEDAADDSADEAADAADDAADASEDVARNTARASEGALEAEKD